MKVTVSRAVHSVNAFVPIVVTELGISIDFKAVQLQNALLFIVVTELGISIDFKAVQKVNASTPIVMTELGISIEVKALQPEKDELPILVTELGIVILVNVQLRNAYAPMLVTLVGITEFLHPEIKVLVSVLMMALQLSRLSYTVLPCSTLMVVRFGHASKAVATMSVTEAGMVMLVKPERAKAKFPMLSTFSGITMSVRFGQPENA